MSDPVSNAEVEDVLASIRRLVSGEKQNERPAEPHVTAAPSTSGQSGQSASATAPEVDRTKLVLTPALRVMEPEDEAERQSVEEPISDASEGSAATDAQQDIGDAVDQDTLAAENARQAAILVGLAAQQTAEDGSSDRPGDVVDTGSDPDAPEAEVVETPESENTPDAIIIEAKENPTSLSAKIAALEAVIGKRQDTWEPDGVAATDAYSGTEAPALEWEDHVAEELNTPAAVTEPELLEAEEYDDELEDEIPSEPAQAQPVFRPDDRLYDFGATGPEAEADAQLAEAELPDRDALDLTEETDILDEEALRDIVAEIVREELQGALGERITRNVRKLVRREIQRALAAQDLE